MGILVFSLVWVMQDLYHQPYHNPFKNMRGFIFRDVDLYDYSEPKTLLTLKPHTLNSKLWPLKP